MTKRILQCVVLMLTLSSTLVTVVGADGGKAKNTFYTGQVQPPSGNGELRFTVDTSPIIFYLGTVNNKYHVLLIRVNNNTGAPLKFSKDQDTVELRFSGNQRVKGLLNLPASDRATWDGLETEIRTAVAYPDIVEPHEEEGIYCYVAVSDVKSPRKKHEMPGSIIYNIKSLRSPVELRLPAASAA